MTSEDEEKVKALIQNGKTATEVSSELNINYNSVYYFLSKSGIYKRCHKYTDADVRFIKDNYMSMSIRDISYLLNIPVQSIYNKARNLGLIKYNKKKQRG